MKKISLTGLPEKENEAVEIEFTDQETSDEKLYKDAEALLEMLKDSLPIFTVMRLSKKLDAVRTEADMMWKEIDEKLAILELLVFLGERTKEITEKESAEMQKEEGKKEE